MKLLVLALALTSAVAGLPSLSPPARAQQQPPGAQSPTAYAALRVVQKELGADSLGRVVDISGREGVPQPFIWKVLLLDKAGGPGLREVEVAGGRLAGSRTVSRSARPGAGVSPINLRDLNLDSSGAFSAADAQGRRSRVSFDAINYGLRVDAAGKPVWTLQFLDADRRDLGTMLLAASDGAVLSSTGAIAVNVAPITTTTDPASDPNAARGGGGSTVTTTTTITAGATEEADARAEGGFLERSGRTLDKTGRRVERTLDKTGRNVERTMRRTGESIGDTFERFFRRGEGGPATDGRTID